MKSLKQTICSRQFYLVVILTTLESTIPHLNAQNRQIESYIDYTRSYRSLCNENGQEEYTMNAGINVDVLGWCYSNNRQCNTGGNRCTVNANACSRTSPATSDALLITVSLEGWENDRAPRSVYNAPQDDCHDNGSCAPLDVSLYAENTYYSYTCSGNSHEVATIFRWFYATVNRPSAFTVSAPNCPGSVYLNAIASTQSNVTWYWQGTNATGTSTANPSTSNYNISANGTYYLRARGNRNGLWSTARSLTVNNVQSALNNPGAIALSTSEICVGGSATINNTAAATGSPASTGPTYQYYWRRSSTPVTGYTLFATTPAPSITLPTAVTNTAGTYYVARHSSFACTGYATNGTTLDIGPLTVSSAHTAATSTTTDVLTSTCSGATVTLTTNGIPGLGGSLDWYTATAGGGTYIGTGSPVTHNPTTDVTYYALLSGTICPDIESSTALVNVKNAKDNLVLPSLATHSNLEEQCTINGWTYFATSASPDDWLFSIRKNTQSTMPTFDVSLDDAGSPISSVVTSSPSHGSYLMRRYWNVHLVSGSIANGIDIRFYYDPADLTAAVNQRDTDFVAYSGGTKGADIQWFKTNAASGGFDPSLITPNLGNKWSFSYDHLPGSIGIENGITYVQFNGLTSLSGGTGGTTFGEGNPLLPVEIVSFSAKSGTNNIELEWITASEINNDRFEVYRSADASFYEKIGEVSGNGNSSILNKYQFIDNKTDPNVLYYYQLKQIDFDGTASYSKIVSAIINQNEKLIVSELFPNPTSGQSYLDIISPKSETIEYSIANILGQLVLNGRFETEKGTQTFPIHLDELQPGNYIINIFNSSGLIASRKIVKVE